MLVKYVLGDIPAFRFSSKDVPEGFYLTYIEGEEIFDYLNEELFPTDIENVSMESDGISCNLVIYYRLSEEVIAGMPCFEEYGGDDDMPF